jgi:hypothetical protein
MKSTGRALARPGGRAPRVGCVTPRAMPAAAASWASGQEDTGSIVQDEPRRGIGAVAAGLT